MTGITLLALLLTRCGGGGTSLINSGDGGNGGSGGGGGGGGGGGESGPSISILAPSAVMVGLPQGEVLLYGTGFTQQSQVLMDGQPASASLSNGVLYVQIGLAIGATPGTHQFSVQNGGQTSNSVTYTAYSPQQGPFVMQATPGFLVGEGFSDAPFIVTADVNSDGLADVVMPGVLGANPGSIAILYGQTNGTLSPPQYVSVPMTPYGGWPVQALGVG